MARAHCPGCVVLTALSQFYESKIRMRPAKGSSKRGG